jgi:transposase, IS5 family
VDRGVAMRREGKSASFAEALVVGGGSRRLEAIEGLIEWGAVERLLAPVYAAPTGRASYPVLSLFKAVLLGAWHGLSDPELEAALGDRLSFRRFAGLGLGEAVPDHSTLWRFRDALRRLGLAQAAFAEVNRQLERRGVVVKAGTLIDATLVAAAAKEPAKQKGGGRSAADPDARWAKRATGGAHFGYKLHAGVDWGSGIVRRARLTPANVNEISVGPELVAGDEASVWADKAYVGPTMAQAIAAAGARNRVQRRRQKNRPLRPSETRRNVLIGRVRGRVEGVFGALKRSYGLARLRYMSLARNTTGVLLTLTGWNLARAADRLAAS